MHDENLNYHQLVGERIFQISLPMKATRAPGGRDAYRYLCTVRCEDEKDQQYYYIEIAGTNAPLIGNVYRGCVIASRALRQMLNREHDEETFDLTPDNIESLFDGIVIPNRRIRSEVLGYLDERYDELPVSPVTVLEVISSINSNPDAVLGALENLKHKRWIISNDWFGSSKDMIAIQEPTQLRDALLEPIHINPKFKSEIARVIAEVNRTDIAANAINPDETYKLYKVIDIEPDGLKNGFVFCMTPFDEESLDRFYKEIQPFCKAECGVDVVISMDDHKPGSLTDTIISHIHKCKFAIADISDRNANVMYELGFAHAINKHVIPIWEEAKKGKKIFDIQDVGIIFYKDIDHLKSELKKKIAAMQ
ncbi:MAG: hypothetical protein KAT79_01940 [candidate division Zixibacteria bacterium]|nr:hypothetical protein [candidate division Zixibacteria bacterium]